jgi:hypothetical protein
MRLTPEEVAQIRSDHLKNLQEEEARRDRSRQLAATDPGPEEEILDPAQAAQARQDAIRKVKAEVAEAFYRPKGYLPYENHRGEILWLTPDEHAYRMARRQSSRRRKKNDGKRRRDVQSLVVYTVVALAAVIVGLFLVR